MKRPKVERLEFRVERLIVKTRVQISEIDDPLAAAAIFAAVSRQLGHHFPRDKFAVSLPDGRSVLVESDSILNGADLGPYDVLLSCVAKGVVKAVSASSFSVFSRSSNASAFRPQTSALSKPGEGFPFSFRERLLSCLISPTRPLSPLEGERVRELAATLRRTLPPRKGPKKAAIWREWALHVARSTRSIPDEWSGSDAELRSALEQLANEAPQAVEWRQWAFDVLAPVEPLSPEYRSRERVSVDLRNSIARRFREARTEALKATLLCDTSELREARDAKLNLLTRLEELIEEFSH